MRRGVNPEGHEFLATVRGERRLVRLDQASDAREGAKEYEMELDGAVRSVAWIPTGPGEGCLVVDQVPHEIWIHGDGRGGYVVEIGGREIGVEVAHGLAARIVRPASAGRVDGPLEIRSPMHGLVVHVPVREGDLVNREDPLVVLEAMKMQNAIPSPSRGVVRKVFVQAGQTVLGDALLVILERGVEG